MKQIFSSLLLIGLLVYSSPIHAQNQKVEVYHIEEKKVIKKIQPNESIHSEAEKYLSSISGIYKKINPLPPKGFIVRIPLEPAIKVQNQWIHSQVDEMNIIYPDSEDPYIMIYDDENNFYFFTIDSDNLDLNRLAKYLEINPFKKGEA